MLHLIAKIVTYNISATNVTCVFKEKPDGNVKESQMKNNVYQIYLTHIYTKTRGRFFFPAPRPVCYPDILLLTH